MSIQKFFETNSKSISIGLLFFLVFLYFVSDRRKPEKLEIEESFVSLCQIRLENWPNEKLDETALLKFLLTLKRNDFIIGSPILSPDESLVFFSEHRLKLGAKQSKIKREFQKIRDDFQLESNSLTWTCV